jgi:hypothetical protein
MPLAAHGDWQRFSAEIPGADGEALLRIDLQLLETPQANGEKIHLRARIQTRLGSQLRPLLGAAPQEPATPGRALSPVQRAGRLAQRLARRALAVPAVRRLAEPLLDYELTTHLDLTASTAALDGGSRDLMPDRDKLAALGIHPVASSDQPMAESWAGHAPDGGLARFTLLRLEKRHLPPALAEWLGDRPFALAAAVLNTAHKRSG